MQQGIAPHRGVEASPCDLEGEMSRRVYVEDMPHYRNQNRGSPVAR